jgi:general stress protein YciG
MADDRTRSLRGFAAMDDEKQREIARKGGESVPDEKRSFSRNPNLAAEAGRKGGQNVPDSKRSFSQNRSLAAEAGRKGGQSVPDEKRSFSQNRALAAEAGRKGGQASHGSRAATRPEEDTRRAKRTDGDTAATPPRGKAAEAGKGRHPTH